MNDEVIIHHKILDEFSRMDKWMDRYNYIIELGKSLPRLDNEYKRDEKLIKGCQSKVWLHAKYNDGKIQFFADSDSTITKGIIAILVKLLSNRTPEEILNTDLLFLNNIGIKEFLSPTRSNGLISMIEQIKTYATSYRES